MPGLVKEAAGAKRALSIGIQYHNAVQYSKRDPPPTLQASHRDPDRMKEILTQLYDYKEDDIVILKDDGRHILPTRENILKAIDDLVRDAKAGDHFVFHFSGHGAQIPDTNGDEDDGKDETIWPVDIVYDASDEGDGIANYIVDDELKERLIDSLPAGTHLTVILDCCHSGTGVDLPNSSPDNSDEEDEIRQIWSPISPSVKSRAPFSSKVKATRGPLKKLSHLVEEEEDILEHELKTIEDFGSAVMKHVKSSKVIDNKYVTSWAGCIDSDIELEDTDGGMLTKAFWTILKNNHSQTHLELYKAIEKYLVENLRPAKKEWLERGWGTIARPRPVLASLQKIEDIHPTPFSF